MPDADVCKQLVQINGIGVWTAEIELCGDGYVIWYQWQFHSMEMEKPLPQEYPLELLLKLAELARSSYYNTVKALMCPVKHEEEHAAIRSIYMEHRGRYGYRRVTPALWSK